MFDQSGKKWSLQWVKLCTNHNKSFSYAKVVVLSQGKYVQNGVRLQPISQDKMLFFGGHYYDRYQKYDSHSYSAIIKTVSYFSQLL